MSSKKSDAFVELPPYGAYGPTYKQDSARRKREQLHAQSQTTPEQKAAVEKIHADLEARWNRPFEPGERGYKPPVDQSGQERALEKLVDTEARIAVEGDTAMDDVPFGESGE